MLGDGNHGNEVQVHFCLGILVCQLCMPTMTVSGIETRSRHGAEAHPHHIMPDCHPLEFIS